MESSTSEDSAEPIGDDEDSLGKEDEPPNNKAPHNTYNSPGASTQEAQEETSKELPTAAHPLVGASERT